MELGFGDFGGFLGSGILAGLFGVFCFCREMGFSCRGGCLFGWNFLSPVGKWRKKTRRQGTDFPEGSLVPLVSDGIWIHQKII